MGVEAVQDWICVDLGLFRLAFSHAGLERKGASWQLDGGRVTVFGNYQIICSLVEEYFTCAHQAIDSQRRV